MRLKLLSVTILLFGLLSIFLLPRRGNYAALPSASFQNVNAVIVQDDWEGMSAFSPRLLHGQLQRQGDTWDGNVWLSVSYRMQHQGHWRDCCVHETLNATVPDTVMQRVFHVLRRIPLRKEPYNSVQTHFADFPQPELFFRSPNQTLVFRSESNTADRAPWAVQNSSGEFVTASGAPDKALRLLRPFLHEDELHRLEAKACDPSERSPSPPGSTFPPLSIDHPDTDTLK